MRCLCQNGHYTQAAGGGSDTGYSSGALLRHDQKLQSDHCAYASGGKANRILWRCYEE